MHEVSHAVMFVRSSHTKWFTKGAPDVSSVLRTIARPPLLLTVAIVNVVFWMVVMFRRTVSVEVVHPDRPVPRPVVIKPEPNALQQQLSVIQLPYNVLSELRVATSMVIVQPKEEITLFELLTKTVAVARITPAMRTLPQLVASAAYQLTVSKHSSLVFQPDEAQKAANEADT